MAKVIPLRVADWPKVLQVLKGSSFLALFDEETARTRYYELCAWYQDHLGNPIIRRWFTPNHILLREFMRGKYKLQR